MTRAAAGLALTALLVMLGTAKSKASLPNDALGHSLAALGLGTLHPRLVAGVPPPRIPPPPTPNAGRLLRVEQKLSASAALPAGPARFDSLLGYYEAANPEAFARLSALRDSRSGSRLTYLRVPADDTRTFLFRRVGPEGSVRFEVLPRVDARATGAGEVLWSVATPRGGLVLSRGRRVPDAVARLAVLDRSAPAWVVGGLQGVHPETVAEVLCELEDRAAAGDSPPIVVVLDAKAREPQLAAPRRAPCAPGAARPVEFDIEEPSFRTTGDMILRIEDHSRTRDDGRAVDPVNVLAFLARFPWLRPSFSRLQLGQATISFSLRGPGLKETTLRAAFLSRLTGWNADIDGRPGEGSPRYDEYIGMLGAIAAHYSNQVNEDGVFVVADGDWLLRRAVSFPEVHVPVASPEWHTRLVPVRALLDGSRLTRSAPAERAQGRYRFEPEWLISVLAGRSERALYAVATE